LQGLLVKINKELFMSWYCQDEQNAASAAFGVVGSALSGAIEARKHEDIVELRQRMVTLNEAMNALEAAIAPQRPYGRGPAEVVGEQRSERIILKVRDLQNPASRGNG
jgi:hypothetical protein